mmetsp:Transcript_12647/g.29749  ORF Transcript_12647/g.29749 Transcript_12647/m.29749 type:complete len:104 (+) Transcript_12647:151-462(+)
MPCAYPSPVIGLFLAAHFFDLTAAMIDSVEALSSTCEKYQPAPSPQPSPTLKDASLSKSPPNRLIGPSPLPPPSIFIVLVLAAIDRGTGATAPWAEAALLTTL